MTDSSSAIANWSPLTKRLIFPTMAVLPPVLVALLTEDLGILVSITGKNHILNENNNIQFLPISGWNWFVNLILISTFLKFEFWSGAYAGAGIQYIIPCSLVFLARKKLIQYEEKLNLTLQNPLESFFKHNGFIVTVVVWSLLAVGLVTTNFILKAIK